AWNGNNPWFLGQQPGKCNLSRCRILPLRDLAKEINKSSICLHCLRRESRQDVAEIRTVELGVFVHLSGEEALAERAKRDEADAQLLESGQHLDFGTLRPQ